MSSIKEDVEQLAATARADIGVVEAKVEAEISFIKANAKPFAVALAVGAAIVVAIAHYL